MTEIVGESVGFQEQPVLVKAAQAEEAENQVPQEGERYAKMLTVEVLHRMQDLLKARLDEQRANMPAGDSGNYLKIMDEELVAVNAFLAARAQALTERAEELQQSV